MAADRIRESAGSLTPYRTELSSQSPTRPANTVRPASAPPESGFDVGGPHYARAEVSGSFDAPMLAPATKPQAQLESLKTSLSLQEKKEFLEQFGVSGKHLKKAKAQDIEKAFGQVVDQLQQPGSATLKFKIGGKKYEGKIRLDPNSGELDIQFKQKKGFFGKLWDGVKKVGKIALTVASFIPGPIGVVARVASAVISAVNAFKKGDILGGIAGLAGGIAGGMGALAGKAVSGVAKTIGTVASVVEKGANAAKGVADAIKNRNWGGLLTAVASGASGMAGALGNSAQGVVKTMNQVSTWATRGNTALQMAVAARNGDIVGMLDQGSQLASGIAPNSRAADTFQRLASGATTAQNVISAAKSGDVLGAITAGAEFASTQVRGGSQPQRTLEDLSSYASTANSVQNALRTGDYMGAAQQLTGFAAGEVNDPKAKRTLQKASEIFSSADAVENALQGKDLLAAAAAATAMAGRLTGSEEVQDAGKLIAAAGQLRSAVKASDAAQILKAILQLKDAVREATTQTQLRSLPAAVPGRRQQVA
ncbi:MAG: hypothetical protein M3Y59_15790 [Myxococcota bacterium]|nr:hypothetical protein [Myxococcota bacterium]